MKTPDLKECREKLDGIDREIVRLFEERMAVCGQVAEYKIETGKAVYDGEREKQKLAAVREMAAGDQNKEAVEELFTQLMTCYYARCLWPFDRPWRDPRGTFEHSRRTFRLLFA